MPLVFYDKADYATAMATIALPMNLINALAPPTLAALLTSVGARGVFASLGGLSIVSLAILLRLNGMRGHSRGSPSGSSEPALPVPVFGPSQPNTDGTRGRLVPTASADGSPGSA